MMMIDLKTSYYKLKYSANFKRSLRIVIKQGKEINKIRDVLIKLSNGIKLDRKYKNHKLNNNKEYKNCYECYIEPDWLLIYKYIDNELILLLIDTGSHSDMF